MALSAEAGQPLAPLAARVPDLQGRLLSAAPPPYGAGARRRGPYLPRHCAPVRRVPSVFGPDSAALRPGRQHPTRELDTTKPTYLTESRALPCLARRRGHRQLGAEGRLRARADGRGGQLCEKPGPWSRGLHQSVTAPTETSGSYYPGLSLHGSISRGLGKDRRPGSSRDTLARLAFRSRAEGAGDLVHAIIEVSGDQERKDKAAKVATARTLWAPAVNNHGGFGRWVFVEVTDPWDAARTIRGLLGNTEGMAA